MMTSQILKSVGFTKTQKSFDSKITFDQPRNVRCVNKNVLMKNFLILTDLIQMFLGFFCNALKNDPLDPLQRCS